MDDRPAIEYHPFGTITLNFDDGPIKLRKCRVGDLKFAKDALEEARNKDESTRLGWAEELRTVRDEVLKMTVTEKTRPKMEAKVKRLQELSELLTSAAQEISYTFLSQVAERMGDSPPPAFEEWPVELLFGSVPNEVLEHWQTRPLVSGRLLPNPMTTANGQTSSELQPLEAGSPPAPQPQ